MAFTKMKSVCDLEERHGVSLGSGYKNDHACATFIEFIAKEQQQILTIALSKSSLQADSSVDAGHVELELFLVSYLDTRSMVTILATNGWDRSIAATFGHAALNYVCSRFCIPLQEANVNCILVPEEWDDILDYAKRYLVQDEYKTNWWKLNI